MTAETMNAERLLALYERIADSPDAIYLLRRFIIDAAVGGELSDADTQWTRAPIERCLAPLEDRHYIHQGWSPRCETYASRKPEQWGVLKTTAIQDGFFLEDENKELPTRLTPKPRLEVAAGDILITCAGPRARCGIACWVPEVRPRLMISGKMYRFRADESRILPAFLALFLRSSGARKSIDGMKTGSSESGLNLTKERFRHLIVRHPELDEQREILEKIAEMTALLDQLEKATSTIENKLDRLAGATYDRLTAPETAPHGFTNSVNSMLENLTPLTSRPRQITAFRQSLLDLAVRGKLVQRDHNEPSACTLLQAILNDRKHINRTDIDPDLRSFDFSIPSHWEWRSLDQIMIDGPQNGISPRASEKSDSPKAITLAATTSGSFDDRQYKHIDIATDVAAGYWLEPGDLLFQRGNTKEYVGMAAIYDGPRNEFLFPDLVIRTKITEKLCIRFVHLWCIAPPARHYFSSNASGAQKSMPKINQRILRATPVPVPPLAEQKRIVAKVDEIMTLCDQLGSALNAAAFTKQRLLKALLNEALTDSAHKSEAA